MKKFDIFRCPPRVGADEIFLKTIEVEDQKAANRVVIKELDGDCYALEQGVDRKVYEENPYLCSFINS
jgi:hypothetical protein